MTDQNQLLREALQELMDAESQASKDRGGPWVHKAVTRETQRRQMQAWEKARAALAQPAEGGEVCNVKSSAGLIRPGKVDAWVANHYTNPPAGPSQAQQPEPIQTAPSFAQLKQILDNLDRCHTRDSKAEFLRTWIRDWTQHKIEQRG